MKREFTGQYEQNNRRKKPIYSGDLVTLSIPRKGRLPELIVFRVVSENNHFYLIYYSGSMSEGDPNYKQDLNFQVYKVLGNIETGIDHNLLE